MIEWGVDLCAERLPQDAMEFLERLRGPAILKVPGRDRSRARIVTTLLHGNEPSGLRAMHRWLHEGKLPAVDTLFFIGVVRTALTPPGFANRFLPGNVDFNRCWTEGSDTRAGALAQEILSAMRAAKPECLIDLHNNTGHNPPYGVAPQLGASELRLVSLFADRYVHTPLQLGTLVEATQDEFPSVTVECGRSGDPLADETAYRGLTAFLDLDDLGLETGARSDMQLLVDPVRVCVREGVGLAFGEGPHPDVDITVSRNIDRHNFEQLDAGALIGWVGGSGAWPVDAWGADGRECSEELFTLRDGLLETRRSLVPVMMTTDRRNALADCLFYAAQPGKLE